MEKLVILTGAGISAESGVKTFRDSGGLWEGFDVMKVASIEGWYEDPQLVLDFYNMRRKQLLEVHPNHAHLSLKDFEEVYDVEIITQNVDDLHERAGSKNVLHLHGELLKVRSVNDENKLFECKSDINLGDFAEDGGQLRPYIVWFGEQVPKMSEAIEKVQKADIFVVIGTSLQVYPAASLLHYVKRGNPIYLVDPKPNITELAYPNLKIITASATNGVDELKQYLL